MEDWKKTTVYHLPKDFLTVNYEFKWEHHGEMFEPFKIEGNRETIEKQLYTIWNSQFNDTSFLYYRKPVPV